MLQVDNRSSPRDRRPDRRRAGGPTPTTEGNYNTVNAAQALRRALARRGEVQTDVADAIRRAIDPRKPAKPMDWVDKAIELERRNVAFKAQQEADQKAAEEAANAPKTAAGILVNEMTKAGSTGAHIPLNGPAIIKAALAGLGKSQEP